MNTKKMPKVLMVGILSMTLLTPYQGVYANTGTASVTNDDGNGDATTNRYLDFKILDGSNELVEPAPVLPLGTNEKTFQLVVNHKAGELDGRDAKIQYRVTGAGGKEFKREMVLSGTVGSGFFPSQRLDNSFNFNVKFIRDGTTCADGEVCLPGQEGNYNLSVDVIFEAEDGEEQTFTSLSKTIYVKGESDYVLTDDKDYSGVQNELQYDVYRIQTNGSYTGFSEVNMNDLDSNNPVPIYIEGYYRPESDISYGKNVHIDYDLYAIEAQSDANLVQHFEQNQATSSGTSYLPFNRTFHLSNEKNKGNPQHATYLDVAYLNDYPMHYVMRLSVTVEGETQPRVVLDKPITVNQSSYVKPDYVMATSKALPAVSAGKNLSFQLTDDQNQAIHELDISKLREQTGVKGNILGGILLPDIAKGKEVKVVYTLDSFDEEFVDAKDQIITSYIQNAETIANATGYNKEIYFRVGDVDPLDTRPVIYLKDYKGEYTLKVDLIYGKDEQQVKDTVYWKIDVMNEAVSHEFKQDEHAPYERENAYIDFDLNKVTRNSAGDIASRNAFAIAPVSGLNTTPVELEIRGTLRSPQVAGIGTEFKIGYEVATIEDYSRNTIVKSYIQDANVRGNEVEFNRLFKLSTEQYQLFNGSEKDYIYVENYPSSYVVRVFLEDKSGKTHYFMDKQIQLTNDAGKVVNAIDYLLPQNQKNVPTFDYPTRLDVLVQQYDASGILKKFTEASADEIKSNPLKLNIQSLLRNGEAEGSNMEIKFDVVSYESYLNPYINPVLRKYKQNEETKTYHVEANRDIFISTDAREDRSRDNRESTIYLEDETQYYQIRVEVLKDGRTYMKREFPFKVNGINDPDHKAPQEAVGPESDPNKPISTFLTNPNDHNKPTKRLQLTARQLNSDDGIGVDLDGFIKKAWENQQVLLRYDLVALNTYTDYINGNGVTTTLETDPQAQPDDQQHVLVSTMEEWYGEPSQDSFLKRYHTTNYTKNNYEPFTKHFTLRTKIDQDAYGKDPSTLFLDNVARDYELTVTATNTSTGENIKETIELDITTVKASENHQPEFDSAVSFRQPARGSGWFEGEYMPLSWYAANDADNTNDETEYLYYKIYYYYSTSNSDGNLNAEIQKYMVRYDDMPMAGGVLSTEWQVPFPAKIEPAHIRAYACDVNHVCSEQTKSNPFKFNEFGVGDGAPSNNGGGGISATLSISPKPTGIWENTDKEVFVNYEGAAELAVGAQKSYEITRNSTMPGSFRNTLGTNNRILITENGENYVHVRYILSDGTELYASSGLYRIYKSDIGDFTMSLVDKNGRPVTGWTNQDLFMQYAYTGDSAQEGITNEYRIDNYHNEWNKVTPTTAINVEGERTIYGRVKNKGGTTSEQKVIVSKIDKTPVEFRKVTLTENEKGTYDVSIWAEDTMSGVKRLYLVDNGQEKELEKLSTNSLYEIRGLTTAPTSATAVDEAGNTITVLFTNKPNITFDSPYTLTTPTYRDTVKANIQNGVQLSYKLGSQSYSCQGQDPCSVSIERNTLLTGINTDGIKVTNKQVRIGNIDKGQLRLLLQGQRVAGDSTKIKLEWNYNITNGKLTCYVGGQPLIENNIGGPGVILENVKNAVYDCQISGVYVGETVSSNRVVIYPDSSLPIDQTGDQLHIEQKIYAEESRAGTTYFVNTKQQNVDDAYIPLPTDMFD